MGCTFKKWGVNDYVGPCYCVKADRGVTYGYYCKYCNSSNYDKCSVYQENQHEDCFFTAILEKINKLDIKIIIENFEKFRKDILEDNNKCRDFNKNLEYRALLVMHDRMSPVIAGAIKNTNIDTIYDFLTIIYENYLIPINNFIIENQVEKAIYFYKKMFDLLIVNFSLNHEYASMKYQYKHPELYKMQKGKKIKERRMSY